MSYLDELVKNRLNGDKGCILELFQDDLIFVELIRYGKPNDWLHFEVKTFDGEYFVKKDNLYLCYQQDRGIKFGLEKFENITEAAKYFFRGNSDYSV